jgi:hypothetical protein
VQRMRKGGRVHWRCEEEKEIECRLEINHKGLRIEDPGMQDKMLPS